MATLTAIRWRDEARGTPLRGQVLWYPVVDHYSANHPSYRECGTGLGLTREDMIWFWDQYVDPRRGGDPYVSPLKSPTLEGLPPSFIVTAEYDLLRDEGRVYARRLLANGVPTELRHYEDANHGFLFWVGPMPSANEAMQTTCAWLRARFS